MEDTEWQTTWHSLREILGSKWSFHILRLLASQNYGFNEMKREIDGMTAAMLSRRLKELSCHGFVDRTVEETIPPTTTYRLTEEGSEFARLLREMEELIYVNHNVAQDTCEGGFDDMCGDNSETICVDNGSEDVCVTIAESGC